VSQKPNPKSIQHYQGGWFPFDRLVRFYEFAGTNQVIADSKRGPNTKSMLLIDWQKHRPLGGAGAFFSSLNHHANDERSPGV
jgi:aryl-alcohol dehydrogenase